MTLTPEVINSIRQSYGTLSDFPWDTTCDPLAVLDALVPAGNPDLNTALDAADASLASLIDETDAELASVLAEVSAAPPLHELRRTARAAAASLATDVGAVGAAATAALADVSVYCTELRQLDRAKEDLGTLVTVLSQLVSAEHVLSEVEAALEAGTLEGAAGAVAAAGALITGHLVIYYGDLDRVQALQRRLDACKGRILSTARTLATTARTSEYGSSPAILGAALAAVEAISPAEGDAFCAWIVGQELAEYHRRFDPASGSVEAAVGRVSSRCAWCMTRLSDVGDRYGGGVAPARWQLPQHFIMEWEAATASHMTLALTVGTAALPEPEELRSSGKILTGALGDELVTALQALLIIRAFERKLQTLYGTSEHELQARGSGEGEDVIAADEVAVASKFAAPAIPRDELPVWRFTQVISPVFDAILPVYVVQERNLILDKIKEVSKTRTAETKSALEKFRPGASEFDTFSTPALSPLSAVTSAVFPFSDRLIGLMLRSLRTCAKYSTRGPLLELHREHRAVLTTYASTCLDPSARTAGISAPYPGLWPGGADLAAAAGTKQLYKAFSLLLSPAPVQTAKVATVEACAECVIAASTAWFVAEEMTKIAGITQQTIDVQFKDGITFNLEQTRLHDTAYACLDAAACLIISRAAHAMVGSRTQPGLQAALLATGDALETLVDSSAASLADVVTESTSAMAHLLPPALRTPFAIRAACAVPHAIVAAVCRAGRLTLPAARAVASIAPQLMGRAASVQCHASLTEEEAGHFMDLLAAQFNDLSLIMSVLTMTSGSEVAAAITEATESSAVAAAVMQSLSHVLPIAKQDVTVAAAALGAAGVDMGLGGMHKRVSSNEPAVPVSLQRFGQNVQQLFQPGAADDLSVSEAGQGNGWGRGGAKNFLRRLQGNL